MRFKTSLWMMLVIVAKGEPDNQTCQATATEANDMYANPTLVAQGRGLNYSTVYEQGEFLDDGKRALTVINQGQGLAASVRSKSTTGTALMLYQQVIAPMVGYLTEQGMEECSGAENLNSDERKSHLHGKCNPRCPENETVNTYRKRIEEYEKNSTVDWTQKICTFSPEQAALRQKVQRLIAQGNISNPTGVMNPKQGLVTTWFNEDVVFLKGARNGGKLKAMVNVLNNPSMKVRPELAAMQDQMVRDNQEAYENETGVRLPILFLDHKTLEVGGNKPFSCPQRP